MFLSTITTGLLGGIGSLILCLLFFTIALFMGTDLKFSYITPSIPLDSYKEKIQSWFEKDEKEEDEKEDPKEQETVTEERQYELHEEPEETEPEPKIEFDQEEEEPARMIQRNLEYQINQPKTEDYFNPEPEPYFPKEEKEVPKAKAPIKEEDRRPFPFEVKREELRKQEAEQLQRQKEELKREETTKKETPNPKPEPGQKSKRYDVEKDGIFNVKDVKKIEEKSDSYTFSDDVEYTSSVSDLETSIHKSIESIEMPERENFDFLEKKENPEEETKPEPVVNKSEPKQEFEKKPDIEAEPIKPKLTLTVKEVHETELGEPENLLSTNLHDKNINYTAPYFGLLINKDEQIEVNDEELKTNARILQDKLETFKIYIENLSVTPGPVVTQYEFVPAPGIKISKIESLADDLAMALKARGIRIIAPIPGKGTVGIEIPNSKPSIVRFSSVVRSSKFVETKKHLPLALGKSISGEVVITDLAKMPHLLVAGSTGSGKSVGINTIINSLIFKKKPNELKFAIVDPKKVELQHYKALSNHFLAASPDIDDLIVTSPEEAVILLKSVCKEMDMRYDILAESGQRNIFEYNNKVRQGKIKDSQDMVHRAMPFIVVIIDELADLMLTAGKEVETPITRLAQLARAVGIHLVVATQRPSVDVITGIIKANFPARIGYLVASKVDSRTILDMGGADQLLGNGDMLFLPSGQPKPERVQNSFISTDEVERICEFIEDQVGYDKPYMLPSLIEKDEAGGNINKADRDPLFADAARVIIAHQQGSVSLLQRRLKIGYARAGRIVDELEQAGVVGPYDGSKARKVFMESESELEAIL